MMKRCNSFAFANNLKHVSLKFTPNELKNTIFISDKPNTKYNFSKKPITIDDIPTPKAGDDSQYIETFKRLTETSDNVSMQATNSIPTFIIELARKCKKTIKVPTSTDDMDMITIEDHDYSDYIKSHYNTDDIYDEQIQHELGNYKDAIINFIHEREYFNDRSLTPKFLDFIVYIFPLLTSGELQIDLLKLLNDNGIQTINLEKQNPIQYIEQEVDSVETCSLFSDIKIVIDKSDTNVSSNNSIYKPDKDALKKASLGNSSELEAFSQNKFTVIHSKKSANIDDTNVYRRNHDILHSLARNGVVR